MANNKETERQFGNQFIEGHEQEIRSLQSAYRAKRQKPDRFSGGLAVNLVEQPIRRVLDLMKCEMRVPLTDEFNGKFRFGGDMAGFGQADPFRQDGNSIMQRHGDMTANPGEKPLHRDQRGNFATSRHKPRASFIAPGVNDLRLDVFQCLPNQPCIHPKQRGSPGSSMILQEMEGNAVSLKGK